MGFEMSTTLSKISEFISSIVSSLSSAHGIGYWLFVAGFVILILMATVILLKLFIMAVKAIPNMTIRQFIKFMVALALVLMIAGIFL
jgi:hypothetical protein